MIDSIIAIDKIIQEHFGIEADVQLTRPDPKFGDYATNVALQLAKPLKKNPRDIATELAEKLRADEKFSSVDVAGPGFINLTLSDQAMLDLIKRRPETKRAGKTVVIETNSPNPFKAMHIGHAYNSIVPDAMANLLAVDGATVHRVSYHGDVGAHVGKSMWAILKETGGDIEKLQSIPKADRNEFMSKMYVLGAKAAKEDPEAKKQIDELAKESFVLDDPVFTAMYKLCCSWSYEEIDATVKRLGNQPTERRYVESETEELGVKLIKERTPDVFKLSDGAYIFEGSKYGSFDNVYVASNGNGLYGAHDMGLIQLKYRDYPALDESIVVTGEEQADYFKGVNAAAGLAIPKLNGKLFNYPTGLVKLTTGKMSSRTGDVVTIDWLFEEFAKAIESRGGEANDELIAGALRYQFLKVKLGGDVVFDINEAVSVTGNTGSYLQYAHARARSIMRKASDSVAFPKELFDEDRRLISKLGEFSEVVERAAEHLELHHICNYLFELAQEFNRYYEKNQVIGSEKEAHRVGIVGTYADVLKAGLTILGITAPEKL